MIVGIPRETTAGERRVALVPDLVAKLTKAGLDVLMETGAGLGSGFTDEDFVEVGVNLSKPAFSGGRLEVEHAERTRRSGRLKKSAPGPRRPGSLFWHDSKFGVAAMGRC